MTRDIDPIYNLETSLKFLEWIWSVSLSLVPDRDMWTL